VTEATPTRSNTLWHRMLRAALLDVKLYEEVEADRRATGQAAAAVVLSSVAAGIGGIQHQGVWGVVLYAIAAVASWWVWAYVAYWIGTRLLPGPATRADSGELLRTIGFSSAPGVLRIFALFPPIAAVAFAASTIWMLVAMVVAVRQALDYAGTARALAVCAIGFPIYASTLAVALLLLGPWPL
jgi:Yip1-like protein